MNLPKQSAMLIICQEVLRDRVYAMVSYPTYANISRTVWAGTCNEIEDVTSVAMKDTIDEILWSVAESTQ